MRNVYIYISYVPIIKGDNVNMKNKNMGKEQSSKMGVQKPIEPLNDGIIKKAPEREGKTALDYASAAKNKEAVEILKNNAEKGMTALEYAIVGCIKEEKGETALMVASENKYNEVVEILKNAGAKE